MASNEFQPLQGMSDIHAPEIYLWHMIEEQAHQLFSCYGYEELRTPSLEKLSVTYWTIEHEFIPEEK